MDDIQKLLIKFVDNFLEDIFLLFRHVPESASRIFHLAGFDDIHFYPDFRKKLLQVGKDRDDTDASCDGGRMSDDEIAGRGDVITS